MSPTLDGKPIKLEQYEISRSLAVHPDSNRFVLGADWWLRAFDAKGQPLWQRAVPGAVGRSTSPTMASWWSSL